MKKTIALLSCFSLFLFAAVAQKKGVAINASGLPADSTAMLDVSSSTKGVLISRMSTNERFAISKPAVGLMVYDTTIGCLCIYNGTTWHPLCADLNLNNGLLAHYKFNGNLVDSSGNNLHANASGSPVFTADKNGRPGKALAFDGVNDYLVVNDFGILNVPKITISLQFKTNANKVQELLTRIRYNDAHNFNWVAGIAGSSEGGGNYSPNFTTISNTNTCDLPVSISGNDILYSNQPLEPGKWYHLVCVFDRGLQKIYINGQLKGVINRSFTALPMCNSSQLIFGSWWGGDPAFLNGAIDEVRIYGRILNEAEIAELTTTL